MIDRSPHERESVDHHLETTITIDSMMDRIRQRFFRCLSVCLLAGVILALLTGIRGHSVAQDIPAADCASGPNVACPAPTDPSALYIVSVTAAPDGVIILLTEPGLDKTRACGGAETIARMSETLYAMIPADQKSTFAFDWGSPQLLNELYGHAFLEKISRNINGLESIHEEANPINIVFADYGGPGTMTTEARTERATFEALAAAHRLECL